MISAVILYNVHLNEKGAVVQFTTFQFFFFACCVHSALGRATQSIATTAVGI
jgi:hypothetical protein